MKKILIFLILLIASCGYQPIYLNSDTQKLKFSKILIQGNNKINKAIFNSISFEEIETDKSLGELMMNSSYDIIETAKILKAKLNLINQKFLLVLK